MGLLRDWHYIEKAVQIPALSEVIREALIRALFVRDDRVLPRDLIGDLNRVPPVTVKVKDDGEVRKLVRVLNGQESTVSLGLSAEDYHYFRTQLGVGRTREFGAVMKPRILLTYDWISSGRTPTKRSRRLGRRGSSSTMELRRKATRCRSCRRCPWTSRSATHSTATRRSHRIGESLPPT